MDLPWSYTILVLSALCHQVTPLFHLHKILADDLHEVNLKKVEDEVKHIVRKTDLKISHENYEKIVKNVDRSIEDAVKDIKVITEYEATIKQTGCQCLSYNCGCCVDVKIPDVFDNTLCANITYLPADIGILVSISIDGQVIYRDTISARNPPPICLGVPIPHLEHIFRICLRFYKLDISTAFSGCMKFEIEALHHDVVNADLGCFSIPLEEEWQMIQDEVINGNLKNGNLTKWNQSI